MQITYKIGVLPTTEQVIELYEKSGIGKNSFK